MTQVRMLKTGLTLGKKVRRQGEVVKLPSNMPVSVSDQIKSFKKGKPWYVEVGSEEELTILAVGLPSERDAFSSNKSISPGFAPASEEQKDMVTEQVPAQPTDLEIEDSMVGDTEASVVDEEEEEEDSEETEDDLSQLTRKELREVIIDEELEVQYSNSTNRNDLIAGITSAREEE